MPPAASTERAGAGAAEELSEYERRRDDPGVYAQRAHPMSPEVEFEVGTDRLAWRDAKGSSGELPLREIARVRLSYDPSRMMAPRHVLDLFTRAGGRIRITSTTYRGLAQFRPRNRAFAAFVRRLDERLVGLGSDAVGELGRGWPRFVLLSGLWIVLLGATAVTVVALALSRQWVPTAVLGAMAAYFGWVFWCTARLNLPRAFRVGALPEEALPRPSPSDV
jgi:hypothetical protein